MKRLSAKKIPKNLKSYRECRDSFAFEAIQLLPKFALANLIKWMVLFSILNQAIEFEGESAQTYSNVGAQRRVLKNSFASFKSGHSTK